MQENRSFDHYFGTLRGVRGFGDKQTLTRQNGNSIFQQPDARRTDLGYLLPYNLTDQVDGDLDHGWPDDHEARNGALWNNWVPAKTEETMGYFTRDDFGSDAGPPPEVTTYPELLQKAGVSSTTPPTATTAGPACWPPGAPSRRGRPTPGRRR